jgi:5-methylcytosine-specific restriction enzyme subunit McrC
MELGEHFLCKKIFLEHHSFYERDFKITSHLFDSLGFREKLPSPIYFKNKEASVCFEVHANQTINNSYFVGTDWLNSSVAVYVQPKLNREGNSQVNYLQMLFEALKHPDVFDHTSDLFEIKWDKAEINLCQQQDLLTPLVAVQFLQLVKKIVQKGLKKSYYKIEQNLNGRIKGKVIVSKNIKHNLSKSKNLNSFCSFEEFGVNGIENRIIKKALIFIRNYISSHKNLDPNHSLSETFNYIMPAFEQVEDTAVLIDCQNIKTNPFYKEYKSAIENAIHILKRFGHNINNTTSTIKKSPPFWIDMSKLFELYVLGLLKNRYKNYDAIEYHLSTRGNELDFILNSEGHQMVLDAKYKMKYQNDQVNHEDIRQISGYARLQKVYEKFNKQSHELIECMILYPEGELKKGEKYTIELTKSPIKGYVGVYKSGVKLPIL